ncbi:hypothetical protein [Streptomyces violascens]|uniref:hypothetical protein n=1 Tax=Streptomyces violascens TaxID=67381 RepID=UPI001674CD5A|nr:hypothetical protein [Streptomyces violascens]GGU38756.1 hypothetical protein GCM10010289_69540 [Streptomyces violascens]
MPDGTIAELAGAALLHAADSIATVHDGAVTMYASYRFAPGWKRMTSAHALANRYGVEATHAGRGSWSSRDALKSDVPVHSSGVLIVETRGRRVRAPADSPARRGGWFRR